MAEYRRELTRNTLIWKDTYACDRNGYQVRMITRARIPGLLTCRCQMIDGELYFYYDATDYQPFSSVYAGKNIQKADMTNLMYAVREVLKSIREYLLDPSAILLDPEYIFVSPDKTLYAFCYVPGRAVGFEEAFGELSEFFLEKLDHNQQEAVILGYEIYRKVRAGQACLEQVMSLLEERPDPREMEVPCTERKEAVTQRKPEMRVTGKRKKTIHWRGLMLILFGIGAGIIACFNRGLFAPFCTSETRPTGVRIEAGVKTPGIFSGAGIVWGLILAFVGILLLTAIILWKKKRKKDLQKAEMHQGVFEVTDPTVFLPSVPAEKGRKLISIETQEETLLTGERFWVGKRSGQSGLVILADTVSRKHACFIFREGEWYVEDCGSSNGTYVNGHRLEDGDQLQLMQGDEICFADKTYLYL